MKWYKKLFLFIANLIFKLEQGSVMENYAELSIILSEHDKEKIKAKVKKAQIVKSGSNGYLKISIFIDDKWVDYPYSDALMAELFDLLGNACIEVDIQLFSELLYELQFNENTLIECNNLAIEKYTKNTINKIKGKV